MRLSDTFDEYVYPGENALWDPNVTAVHGLHSQSPEIVDADPIYLVWKRFKSRLIGYHAIVKNVSFV